MLPSSAYAQMHGVVALNSEVSHVDLENKVFLFEDKFKKYNLSAAWKEITSNPESFLADEDTLRLTNASSSYWMLLRINNQSETENWVLDFGDTFNGRSGFVRKIMAYDVTSRKLLLKIFGNENEEKEKRDNLIEGALMLDLPIGKTSQLMFYVEPASKKPFIIAPRLFKKTQYFGRGIKLLDRHNMTVYSYIALLFMMVTFSLIYRKPHQLFGSLFLLFGLIHYLTENTVLYIDSGLHEKTLFFSYILMQVSVFYVFYNYFYDKVISSVLVRQLSMGVPVLAVVVTAFSVIAVPDDYAYFVYLLAICMMAALSIVLFAANFRSRVLVKYLIIIAGLLYTLSYLVGSISIEFPVPYYTQYVTYAYVYGQLALSLLLILAMPIRRPTDKKSAAPLSGLSKNVFQSTSNFRDSKDVADRERLLRVLDRERELLDEARKREAEKTDEMRLAKDLADDANKAKSAFLAVISHEIRTPITGVLGMVKLLLSTQMSVIQKDYAQTIQDSGEAMLALLNDILDYEKIESGKLDLEIISFDVRRMMQGIERLMTGHAEAKNIGLILSVEPEVPEYVVGDPTRLRQIVLNLLSNAIKFTDHGDVRILVKMIDMGAASSEDKTKISSLSGDQPVHSLYFGVQDSGIGLSTEAQKNLFTPFTQAKAETTRKYGGTGLGLSICQKLVNAMGGEISVSSKENEGSMFFFTLDMEEGDPAEALSEESGGFDQLATSGKSYKVLCVDDNSINLKVLNGFLDKLGHQCIKAESGEESIELLMQDRYDLILMDVNMRGISGLETTRMIREMQHVEKSAIPIVALTGNSGQDAVHECYQAGMDDFVLKPVNPKGLSMIMGKLETSTFGNEITTKRYKEIREALINGGHESGSPVEGNAVTAEPSSSNVLNVENTAMDVPQDSPSMINVDDLPPLPAERDILGTDLDKITPDLTEAGSQPFTNEPEFSPLQKMMQNAEVDDADDIDSLVANATEVDADEHPSFLSDIEARGEIFESSLLEALKLSMDQAELISLLDGFDEKAQEILGGLNEAYQKKDWSSLALRAHEMKGMSGNFGLRALSEFMKELETIVKHKKFNDVEYFMVRIPMAYRLGIKRIRAWISG
tara:strand:- start:384465 stop:387776 length:3312 start_codon:yes stop_codon:yes gene_type:complete